jgi:topoisomerase-4 subunit B
MSDMFSDPSVANSEAYTAKDIEVLEGLEPVRRRPGMYIGGTDERAMHHLMAEILDNAMDEAVAGHASTIDVELGSDGALTIRDNGRGIPVDPHPKHPDKSALEVIMTTLHSGGKFGGSAYKVSGGLHGVGISVVNALSSSLVVEVARSRQLYRQEFSRGKALGPLQELGPIQNRRGTTITFMPDPQIFGEKLRFKPAILYRMTRSKAFLFRGVTVRWTCAPDLLGEGDVTPQSCVLHFPNGIGDFLQEVTKDRARLTPEPFCGTAELADDMGSVEWAALWPDDNDDGFFASYCNTIPTPEGGTHENGFRNVIVRGLKAYAEMAKIAKADKINADDVFGGSCALLSLFIRDPQFQGQTKEKLVSNGATRLVEQAVKDHFDHWLSADPEMAKHLIQTVLDRAEDRLRRKQSKELSRKSATKRLRLPGKLSDCSRNSAEGSELFLVEGDSAGGSAKQARNRETQAILPLRGKILNVASASVDKLKANQELKDIIEALGCGVRDQFDADRLRYEKIIIMTDADVDGAHIASLLMTFFYKEMPRLVEAGHLYLAMPPLYRMSHGATSVYARDDDHREELMKTVFKGKTKIDVSRFKGLGEMPPAQLKETTMDPAKRTLLRVQVPSLRSGDGVEDARETAKLVDDLMGKKPELRFRFIQENARFADNLDF